MLSVRELEAQAKALAPVLKGYVESSIQALKGDIERLMVAKFEEMQAIQQKSIADSTVGADEIAEIINKLFQDAPKPENGAPGKDADPAEVAELVLAQMPTPEPGKSVTVDDVRPMLEEMVAALPAPEPGKDADPEVIERMVAEAVAKIPPAQDGKSVSVEDLSPVIAEFVEKAVSEIPKPKDGEPFPAESVQEMVFAEVVKVFSTIDLPKDGEPGKDGESVPVEVVEAMIGEAVTKAVSEIEIPTPKDGKDGKDAESVPVEKIQLMVSDQISKAIAEIKMPKDGSPGRDALDLDILPEIDPEKSYPRNTYAQHNGGLWRSHCKTSGMRGWECIVNGQHEVTVDQVDARNYTITITASDGRVTTKSMMVPAMIYRDVWREDVVYQKGDVVTWAGSVWHCESDENTKPGVGESGWKLAVKKGRDAK